MAERMEQAPKYRVTRDVSGFDEHNYSGKDVPEGTILYKAMRPTYGCVDTRSGIALSEDQSGDYPFFEFPLDAVEAL